MHIVGQPDVVARYKEGKCRSCWESEQASRPFTPKEQAAVDALEAWNRARAMRILNKERKARWADRMLEWQANGGRPPEPPKQRSPEEIYTKPVFKLEYRGTYPRMADRMHKVSDTEREERFQNGSIHYSLDERGEWRFKIVPAEGEPLPQSEGYASLRSCQRGAKRLAAKRFAAQQSEDSNESVPPQ
jgi:uncharacterized protein YegP (UPF0339 family)